MSSFWSPIREVDALRREVDRVFSEFSPHATGRAWPARLAARAYPRINVYENEEGFVVEALAPGLDASTLNVSIQGNVLTLSGTKATSPDVKPEAYHRRERGVGEFRRTVQLDCDISDQETRADYTNGILSVHIPKAETARPKQIDVKVE